MPQTYVGRGGKSVGPIAKSPIFEEYSLLNLATMFKLYGSSIHALSSMLAMNSTHISEDIAELRDTLDITQEATRDLRMPLSRKYAAAIIESIDGGEADADRLKSEVAILHRRMWDELEEIVFLILTPKEREMHEKIDAFGEEVSNKLPDVAREAEFAAKCWATAQPTACVLHLMRAIDKSLEVLGQPFGISTATNPNWHSYLDKLHKGLNAHYETSGEDGWHRHNEFYRDVIPLVYRIKNAWRNPSFHAAASYQPDQALDIFDAVGGFCKMLAQGLPIRI